MDGSAEECVKLIGDGWMAKIVLKDGWVYRGTIISESDSRIIIVDRKLNKEIDLAKDVCAVISRGEF